VYAKSSSGRSISVGPVEALTKLSSENTFHEEINYVNFIFVWFERRGCYVLTRENEGREQIPNT